MGCNDICSKQLMSGSCVTDIADYTYLIANYTASGSLAKQEDGAPILNGRFPRWLCREALQDGTLPEVPLSMRWTMPGRMTCWAPEPSGAEGGCAI